MSPEVLGPQDFLDRIPMRDFGAHHHADMLPARPFEKRPSIAVLSTGHDRRTDWLRAGRALEQVLLVATPHASRHRSRARRWSGPTCANNSWRRSAPTPATRTR
ncbi:hypothetical protein [Streptomyces sp. NBC_00996]|uniref:hypothetical protein n=1 Tax=Streptomyces sp. NBC_00996 TaxID=2903710 RepID=UPI00386E0713